MNRIFIFIMFAVAACAATRASADPIPYTWSEALKEAKRHHPDLISAAEDVRQAQADKISAQSGLLPQVDANLSAAISKDNDDETYSYGLSGSQLIFDGFKTVNEALAARRQLTATEFRYLVVASEIRLRLRSAFIDLLRAQDLVTIADAIAQRRKDNLGMVQLRYEAGREHKGALLTAEANLAQAEAQADQARRNLGLAQRRLLREMGHSDFRLIEARGDLQPASGPIEETAPSFETIAESTPFLKELIQRKEAARYGVASAKADLFPSVFADADIGRSEASWPPGNEDWSAGLRVSLPLFDGGDRAASIKRARSEFRQSQAEERSGRDEVVLTLHETWVNWQDALAQVAVQNKFLESAEARAKIGEAQYTNGLITFDDWIIIEDALVRTRRDYLDAQANGLTAEARWAQAKGRTLDDEE